MPLNASFCPCEYRSWREQHILESSSGMELGQPKLTARRTCIHSPLKNYPRCSAGLIGHCLTFTSQRKSPLFLHLLHPRYPPPRQDWITHWGPSADKMSFPIDIYDSPPPKHQRVLSQMRLFPKPLFYSSSPLLWKYLLRKVSCELKHCELCRILSQDLWVTLINSKEEDLETWEGDQMQFRVLIRLECVFTFHFQSEKKALICQKKIQPFKERQKVPPKINPKNLTGSFEVRLVNRK